MIVMGCHMYDCQHQYKTWWPRKNKKKYLYSDPGWPWPNSGQAAPPHPIWAQLDPSWELSIRARSGGVIYSTITTPVPGQTPKKRQLIIQNTAILQQIRRVPLSCTELLMFGENAALIFGYKQTHMCAHRNWQLHSKIRIWRCYMQNKDTLLWF